MQKKSIKYTVKNEIVLRDELRKVWKEITDVRLQNSKFPWYLKLVGIPRPLAATVMKEGVGGYREAYFEREVFFRQEIFEWKLYTKYRFKFNASKNFNIGPFLNLSSGPFEILTGGYDLYEKNEGLLLILSSEYRLHGFMGKIFHWPFRAVVSLFQAYLLKAIMNNLKE